MIEYIVNLNSIHIKDSYKIHNENEMMKILCEIKTQYFYSKYFFYNMSYKDLINEWKAHNLLYDLHLFRSHTKDVDLNKNPWYIKLIYSILAKFYFKSWFK